MKISYNWLKSYVPTDLSPESVSALLTGCGLEVENLEKWQSVKGGLEGIVIGEVLTCDKHPNSDHLSLTTVNTGGPEPLKIVCGASNVAAGQKVAVATIGTRLTINDKEIEIQRSKIRGEVSEGMICAEDELGLGTSHAGIMVLDPAAKPGTPARAYFGIEEDYIFEIGLTPNRSDAASHIGVARDLVAVINNAGKDTPLTSGREKLVLPDVSGFSKDNDDLKIEVVIEDSDGNPRYSGITLSGITVKESPAWLKNRLSSIGLRPINNIVDITNFVLFEFGQPLHAFDADKISGKKVVIRKFPKGTKFTTLDEVERELNGEEVMICNTENPMCIGGVFGGLSSGVTEETRNVFIESAYFNPVSIRRTARFHGLQTDASFRFERGADPENTLYALKRAAMMIREIAGGKISSEIVDVYPKQVPASTIKLSEANLNRLIGQTINRGVVSSILVDLGMVIEQETKESLLIRVPSFKVDVTREADVIEEVLRIYGYNNILIPAQVRNSLSFLPRPDRNRVRNVVSDYLSSNGFYEIMNNSLTRSSYYEGNAAYNPGKIVRILNPISRDLDVLRQTLLFGGLETIAYNQNRKRSDLKLYEFGSVYSRAANSNDPLKGYHEEWHLALFLTGIQSEENWNSPATGIDFFSLKGHIYAFLSKLNISMERFSGEPYSSEEITEGFCYYYNNVPVITLGSIARPLLKRFDCRQDVFYADLQWDVLVSMIIPDGISYSELPKFPEVRRDLALLVDSSVTFSEIEKIAAETEKRLLRKVGLFDVYEGEKIEKGKKSYAVSFILRDDEKTLTDKEIDKVMQRLITNFEKQIGAKIR
jgi:phenylalanyl-tRNA synthetase beta chain